MTTDCTQPNFERDVIAWPPLPPYVDTDLDLVYHVLVCGGRDYSDRNQMNNVLDALVEATHPDVRFELVSGTARGADSMGERWAIEEGWAIKRFPADWERFGRSAGYKRNQIMAAYLVASCTQDGHAASVLAFRGGLGTQHMIDIARKSQLHLQVIT